MYHCRCCYRCLNPDLPRPPPLSPPRASHELQSERDAGTQSAHTERKGKEGLTAFSKIISTNQSAAPFPRSKTKRFATCFISGMSPASKALPKSPSRCSELANVLEIVSSAKKKKRKKKKKNETHCAARLAAAI
jgi:hypothetical protein